MNKCSDVVRDRTFQCDCDDRVVIVDESVQREETLLRRHMKEMRLTRRLIMSYQMMNGRMFRTWNIEEEGRMMHRDRRQGEEKRGLSMPFLIIFLVLISGLADIDHILIWSCSNEPCKRNVIFHQSMRNLSLHHSSNCPFDNSTSSNLINIFASRIRWIPHGGDLFSEILECTQTILIQAPLVSYIGLIRGLFGISFPRDSHDHQRSIRELPLIMRRKLWCLVLKWLRERDGVYFANCLDFTCDGVKWYNGVIKRMWFIHLPWC